MTWSRREIIGQGLLLGAAGLGSIVPAATQLPVRRPQSSKLPARIAYGSCADQNKPQPIWEAVLATNPDLFVFLGDNIYADTRDMKVLREQYGVLARQPGFRRLVDRVPVLAIWDDHDFGYNDVGSENPFKLESQKIFCDFWGEPLDSARRTRDGVYDSMVFDNGQRRLQILLPDLRFNRTPIRSRTLGTLTYDEWARQLERAGKDVPGPYERNPDPAATMLGERQWAWLENQLRVPADIRILASSLQVMSDFSGWEAWINYAEDHQRLIESIRRYRANGLICISGDTHYSEFSCWTRNTPYPLWDFTSSGLTETWKYLPPNARRVGKAWRDPSFGLISIDWAAPVAPRLRVEVRDVSGEVRLSQDVATDSLQVGAGR